jgi:hypothetical protein
MDSDAVRFDDPERAFQRMLLHQHGQLPNPFQHRLMGGTVTEIQHRDSGAVPLREALELTYAAVQRSERPAFLRTNIIDRLIGLTFQLLFAHGGYVMRGVP